MGGLGKLLVLLGGLLVVLGLALQFLPRVPWLGRLPGDFFIKTDHVTIYIPLATSIVVSLLLTLLLNLFIRR
ncbi:MAG: DUF2905 domain-containing protein [Deltaproteobacteria bacterium]|nr:DUF2905 domain-containing protein [Deltaproteobacteria bacterium]